MVHSKEEEEEEGGPGVLPCTGAHAMGGLPAGCRVCWGSHLPSTLMGQHPTMSPSTLGCSEQHLKMFPHQCLWLPFLMP